jgi:phosphohistidine phosphatase
MKTLYIARHAKSSWDHPGLHDHQRPLIPKGVKRTTTIADYLVKHQEEIDLIISSSAVRAYETAKILAQRLNYDKAKIQIEDSLYHANIEGISEIIYTVANDVKSLMIFGHNPTFTHFSNLFLEDQLEWLPTSGIVCIEFDTDKWENLHIVKKTVKFVITPKSLRINK